MKEALSTTQEVVVHYYESEKELEEEQIEEDEDSASDFLFIGPLNQFNISQFFKSPRAPMRSKRVESIELLMDYFQSQFLTSHHRIFSLESIATRKARLQYEME